ncbi:MAG: IPT/TIG domain-containing protein [Planctomycetota bacterium]|nr:IPT/TIG domain-containing protein [Planctomycetota bacterium]
MRSVFLKLMLAGAFFLLSACAPTVWIGVAAIAASGGGGGGGGGGGSSDLRVSNGANNPGQDPNGLIAFPGDVDVELFQIMLTASSQDVDVSTVTFHAGGCGDDSIAGVTQVNLYDDVNGDGALDAGDALLGGPRQYSGDDGDVTFTLSPAVTISVGVPRHWLLVYDFDPTVMSFDEFCADLWDGSDFVATVGGNTASVSVSNNVYGCLEIDPLPRITSVVPNQGTQSGGDLVQIGTTNFIFDDFLSSPPSIVRFDGVDASNITGVSTTEFTVTTPSVVSLGFVDVLVIAQSGDQATLAGGFNYVPPGPNCSISSVTPNMGCRSGGTTVTITGMDFENDPGTTVDCGGSSGTSVTYVNATTITFVTPAGTVGFADVVVTSMSTTCFLPNGFEYVFCPTITAVSPTQGFIPGGETVTITTQDFIDDFTVTPPTAVQFGGLDATNIVPVDASTITADTPAAPSEGLVDVVVTAGAAAQQATATNAYEYLPIVNCTILSISPLIGTISGGTTVMIGGTGFGSPPQFPMVLFGGLPATIDPSSTDTLIVCTTPPGAMFGPADVDVMNATGGVCQVLGGFAYDIVGALDPSFNGQGWVSLTGAAGGQDDTGYDISTDSTGRILVTGSSRAGAGADLAMALWVFNDDGTLDSSFGSGATGGIVVENNPLGGSGDDIGRSIVINASDRIYLVGQTPNLLLSNVALAIWAYNPDGTAYVSFGSPPGLAFFNNLAGGGGNDQGTAILDVGNGFVAAGSSEAGFGIVYAAILKVDEFGVLDSSFGSSGVVVVRNAAGGAGDDLAWGLGADPTIGLYVTGESQGPGLNGFDMFLGRLRPSGSLDLLFGPDLTGIVSHNGAAGGSGRDAGFGVAVDSTGSLIVTGQSQGTLINREDMVLWKYGTGGFPDPAFGLGGVVSDDGAAGPFGSRDSGSDVLIDKMGRILVAGVSANDMVVWRFDSSGNRDLTFGVGGVLSHDGAAGTSGSVDFALALTLDTTGRILVTGQSSGAVSSDMVVWRIH